MIVRAFSAHCIRVLTPRWAYEPLSGAGAAKAGGRFNRPGVPAVYLSLEPETAIAEYAQTEALMRPGTLATYPVELERCADFARGYTTDWDPLWQEWDCEWKRLTYIEDIEPPTWVMGDALIEARIPGLLFPSTKRLGGTNLVLFPDLFGERDRFDVHDPNGDLPISPASWAR